MKGCVWIIGQGCQHMTTSVKSPMSPAKPVTKPPKPVTKPPVSPAKPLSKSPEKSEQGRDFLILSDKVMQALRGSDGGTIQIRKSFVDNADMFLYAVAKFIAKKTDRQDFHIYAGHILDAFASDKWSQMTNFSRRRMEIQSEFEKKKKPYDAFIYWDDRHKVDNIFRNKQVSYVALGRLLVYILDELLELSFAAAHSGKVQGRHMHDAIRADKELLALSKAINFKPDRL